jgi:hypothetical protein
MRLRLEPEKRSTPADMEVGQFGILMSGAYAGHVILKAHEIIISLSNPEHTWSDSSTWDDIEVRILKPGTQFTLTIDSFRGAADA